MKKDVTQIKEGSRFKYIIKGSIFSYLFTLVLIFVYSIILAYTNVSDITIPSVVVGIMCVSIFTASCMFCRQIGADGLINGTIISIIYIGAIYIISSFSKTGFYLDKGSALMIFTTIAIGAIGGIIGVNLKRVTR